MVRKSELKFSKPAGGTILSRASPDGMTRKEVVDSLESYGRCLIRVRVNLFKEQ